MKDITIFDNFINDEELEEARQFIGEESLNLHNKDIGYPEINRRWYFLEEDNCYKKIIIDLKPGAESIDEMEDIIPSAKKFILKMINRIKKRFNKEFVLVRSYLNRQVHGQDVTLHIDDHRPNYYTFLLYIGDITTENYDKAGGDLELKTKEITRIEPFTKRAVLFRGYIPHLAYAPLVPGLTRISMAIKLIDTSYQSPFLVSYS